MSAERNLRATQSGPVRAIASASTASIRAAAEYEAMDVRAEDMAKWLITADDATFTGLVEKELRGQLPPDVAAVFGHPVLCERWFHTIKARQVATNGGTQASRWYWDALADRRARAVAAIRESHSSRATRWKPLDAKEGSPRNRAIDRLIADHPDQFEQYLAEERERSESSG